MRLDVKFNFRDFNLIKPNICEDKFSGILHMFLLPYPYAK